MSNSSHPLFAVHGVTSQIAWAGGEEGQVVVTVDGVNWVSRPITGADGIRGLFAFDGQRCVVADYLGGFWRTTDGGINWTPVHNAGTFINGIHFFDDQNGWALGDPIADKFVILETSDGGSTWTPSPNAPPAVKSGGITRCYGWIGSEIGAFGTSNGWVIWRTTNGGAQWDSVRTHIHFQFGLGLSDGGVGLLSGGSGGGALLDRSTDSGESWQAGQHPPQATPLRPIEWIDGTNEVWGATNQSGVFQSTDGGSNWVRYVLAPQAEFAANSLSFADANTGWCVGWNLVNNSGRIFKYSVTTGVANSSSAAEQLRVWTYPNPFTTGVTFGWGTGGAGPVEISIYDATGRSVRRAVAGSGDYRWDGRNAAGLPAANGIYLYRVRSGTSEITGRLTKLR